MNTLRRNFQIEELILQLRANAPLFNGNVMAISAFHNITIPSLNLPCPYLLVAKITTSGLPYDKGKGTQQRDAQLSFIICIDNTKQKGSGAGTQSVKVVDGVNPFTEQIENALLNWKPVNIDLADTPMFMDEGALNSDNTRLWHEVLWSVPYVTFNTAFQGLGSQAIDDDDYDPDIPVPLTELAIHYGQEPINLFLDQWIYGPQTDPPPRTDSEIDADNQENAIIYEKVDNTFVVVSDHLHVIHRVQTRQQIVFTIDDRVSYHAYSGLVLEEDPGYSFVFSDAGAYIFSFEGIPLQARAGYALLFSYEGNEIVSVEDKVIRVEQRFANRP